jgi:AcrR family transcriptional regulator
MPPTSTARRRRPETKGERTAERILDAAEPLFAERGFEGASLREIARRAGLQQPGLYNHFANKQALYAAVLDRALQPMLDALATSQQSDDADELRDAAAALPAVMTDILFEHPRMAALFQQALRGDARSAGTRLVRRWLDRLFGAAQRGLERLDVADVDAHDRALLIVAMFNATTGYFLSQRALDAMGAGRIEDPENVARQKRLLERIARAAAT